MQQREKEVERQFLVLRVRVKCGGYIIHALTIANGGYQISQGSQHVSQVLALFLVENFPGNRTLGPLKVPLTDSVLNMLTRLSDYEFWS